ncbi:hypothetical protein C8J25_1176 [Sphingomonas faeni]|uniref:Uncharacterized protein n=2 Tax=Sphingomonas faeni TaxID=185950 RepID=A0A2T5TWG3_9SPHN|nr:hypothetical protein C8J25_1176 [Sphingomonas faeni]
MIAALAILSASCGSTAPPVNLRIDVDTEIDGRIQTSTAYWLMDVEDTFPQGASITIKGSALVIRITDSQRVYGLFRTFEGSEPSEFSTIPAILNLFIRNEDEQLGREKIAPTSPSAFFHYAVDRLRGRKVPICQSSSNARNLSSVCPAFIYFNEINDPNTAVTATVGQRFTLSGHSIQIKDVTATYDTGGSSPDLNKKLLPPFVKPKVDEMYADFPKNDSLRRNSQLRTIDFWRYQ